MTATVKHFRQNPGPQLPEMPAVLPANTEAERVILGSILLDNARYAECSAQLSDEDFALNAHRELFSAMGRMMTAGTAIDTVTLIEEMRNMKALERIGGVGYCADLTIGLPRRIALTDYMSIVTEKAKLRQMLFVLASAWDTVRGEEKPAIDIGREVVRSVKAIFQGGK